jgi:hypothetical protein
VTPRVPLRRVDPWSAAYGALATVVVLHTVGHVINGRRSGDVYWHLAAIDRLSRAPWSPSNPMVDTVDPDAGLSPYLLALGLLVRWTGLSGPDVLDGAAIVLVALLLLLFHRAVRVLSCEPGAPVLALVFTLTLWGVSPWRWSGYLNLNSIGFMAGYPSMAAWCALLATVVVAERLTGGWGWWYTALVAGLVAFVSLTHPISLVGLLPLAVGVAARSGGSRGVVRLSAACLVAAGAALSWPHFPVLELLDGGNAYDLANRPTYREVPARTALALPALVLVAWRGRRGLRDPLVLAGAVGAAVFALGYLTERWTAGRALPFVLFAAHVALADAVARRVSGPTQVPGQTSRSRAVIGAVGVLVVVGGLGSLPGIAAGIPRGLLPLGIGDDERLRSEMDRYLPLAPHLGPGDVVAARDIFLARAVGSTGAATVAPGYPAPFIADVDQRSEDVVRFFYGGPEEREVVAERYGVTHALVPASQPFDAGIPVVATEDYLLFALE